jgi:orotidine-5'-phosphate decarboxylase
MLKSADKLIVALDVPTLQEAQRFVDILYPRVKLFKVGSQLFTACGPEAVEVIGQKGAKVFLDLKFHDIPNTVFSATASSTALGMKPEHIESREAGFVFMMTVHTQGGIDMMKSAARGAEEGSRELNIKKPYIVGVTVLTSETEKKNTKDIVLERAFLAKDAGLDGIVCSPLEAGFIREKLGEEFIIVTPGIRDKDGLRNDQQRSSTVAQALAAGSDFLVVGRPIVKAKDPLRAAEGFLEEIGRSVNYQEN